jgi:hypothetical protein
MNSRHPPNEYKGRPIGIVFLVMSQVLVGVIHVIFGFWILTATGLPAFGTLVGSSTAPAIYSVYTIAFGFLTLIFAVLLWLFKSIGWVGTLAVLIFVIIVDSLTLLNLPSIPGIPKFAGYGEISYGVVILLYLFQAHVRTKYRINF